MLRFRRMRSLQQFAAVQSFIHNLFNAQRTPSSSDNFKASRIAAPAEWRDIRAS
jgi:putative transposase